MKVADQLTWRWGEHPGLSRWAQCNNKHPLYSGFSSDHINLSPFLISVLKWGRGRQKSQSQRSGFIRKTKLVIAGCEDGRGHEPRNTGSLQELERQENGFSLKVSMGNDVLLTPWLQSSETVSDFSLPEI